MVGPIITVLNRTGEAFCNYAVPMLVQSSILIAVLLAVDFVLRRRVRAVFRYCIWMLVFVKLILPPSLCLPTGIGYWLGDHLSVGSAVSDSPDLSATESTKAIPSFAVSSGFQILPSSEMPVETVAPAAPAVPPLPPLSWPATVFLAWFVGFLLLSGLLIQRVWFVKALIAQSQAAKAEVVDIVSDCRRRLGIRKNIELRISPNALSPATCGLFQPRILLPASMLSQLSGQRLRMVLIHELAHIKRGDLWVNFVQTVLQMIYFYNPLLWLANAVVRRVREQAVDEMVLASLGEEARDYSRTLVDVAEIAFMRPALGLRLIGVVESRKALTARLRHIAARPFPKTTKLGIVGLIAVIAIAAILLPMAKAENRDGGEPAYHEDGRRISPTGEPDEATEDDLLENIPPFMHRPDRDRALISALVRTEFQDKVKGTDAAMEAGWQLLDGFYQQICNQRNLRKLSHNLPKVIEAHQRLRYHPQKPRRGYWITNRQIREELTQQEKDTVLATFEGGQVTLEDWFGALSELPPPRRPKDLDTPGQVERLFDNVLKMSILVAEAESRGLDEDEDFLRMMNERPKALRHRFRMPHPDGLTYPRNTIDILPMHVPHGAIGRDPRDMAVYEQLEKTVDLSDLTPEMPFDQALDILKGSVEPPLNIVVLWEDL
ncbi:MAG: M56 family metallopeptidase, partial [Planctomycetota bacterium]